MCQNTKFNLRIIGIHKSISFFRNKYFTNQTSKFHPYRNILKIGILGGKPPGCGQHLVELGMDASVPRADIPGQRIQICALQLHILPVGQDIRYNGMLGGQSGKGVFIRHELARLRLLGLLHQFQFSEQEISELLGGIQIQGMACGFFPAGRQ